MRFLTRRRRGTLVGLLLAAGLCAACGKKPRPPKGPDDPPDNVILISIDTLRADHCGFMGYAKPTTPFLDSLAARGAVFEQHMSNANNTLVSHTSILTGLVPLTHGVIDRGEGKPRTPLRKGFATLAERFKHAGFTTASFTTHPVWLARTFGLDHGFDVVDSDWISAPEISARFLDWYDDVEPEHLFAFLHFYDAHSDQASKRQKLPYKSTPELIREFAGDPPEGFTGCALTRTDCCASDYLTEINTGKEPLSKEATAYLIGLYDAGLRKLDDDLHDLFDELQDRGLLDDTLIVITSDHGEDFMEHGQVLHSSFHEAIMHVPLIVILPRGRAPAVPRVDAVTRSIDIAPTVLELAGLPPIGQGSSLAGCLEQGTPPHHPDVFFTQSILRSRDRYSTYKYVNLGQEKIFYDLDADPGETVNLWTDPGFQERFPKRIERIEARLNVLRVAAIQTSNGVPSDGVTPTLTPEQVRTLNGLGYTGGKPPDEQAPQQEKDKPSDEQQRDK